MTALPSAKSAAAGDAAATLGGPWAHAEAITEPAPGSGSHPGRALREYLRARSTSSGQAGPPATPFRRATPARLSLARPRARRVAGCACAHAACVACARPAGAREHSVAFPVQLPARREAARTPLLAMEIWRCGTALLASRRPACSCRAGGVQWPTPSFAQCSLRRGAGADAAGAPRSADEDRVFEDALAEFDGQGEARWAKARPHEQLRVTLGASPRAAPRRRPSAARARRAACAAARAREAPHRQRGCELQRRNAAQSSTPD